MKHRHPYTYALHTFICVYVAAFESSKSDKGKLEGILKPQEQCKTPAKG